MRKFWVSGATPPRLNTGVRHLCLGTLPSDAGLTESIVPTTSASSPLELPASVAGGAFVHPLKMNATSFRLYGSPTEFSLDDGASAFATRRLHSYVPDVLFHD